MTSSTTENYTLRLIRPEDNPGIAQVIREVSAEHGLTADKGFAVADPILDSLYEVYSQPRAAYWVIEMDGEILGGGGVSGLAGGDGKTAELQKMYISSRLRGKGLAKKSPSRHWNLPKRKVTASATWKPPLTCRPPLSCMKNSGLSSLMPRWVTPATATVKSGC